MPVVQYFSYLWIDRFSAYADGHAEIYLTFLPVIYE